MNTITVRPSAIYALLKVLPLILLSLIFLGLACLIFPAFILVSVLCSAVALYRYWKTRSTLYSLLSEELHITTGIFLRRTDYLELYRVRDHTVTRNLFMQLFGLMNLTLLTTDLTGPVIVLSGIPQSDLAEIIRERVQRARANSKIIELN